MTITSHDPALDARVRVTIGSLELDVDLCAGDEEVVALLGPNGAGKTTLLRVLAGLIPLRDGHVMLDGEVLEAPDRGIRVPPEKRPVGIVFQNYMLFPHLSALDNVAYGLRRLREHKTDARTHAAEWLDRVGLAGEGASRPSQLSGGQQQRVALARALAPEPRVLLLDEPLAALDAGVRDDMRRELRRHLAGFPAVRLLVTHEPLDALALADRIVIIEAGRVVQEGTPLDVTTKPRSTYVADLVGLNLYRGHAHGGVITLADGHELIAAVATSGEVFAIVHPRAVTVHLQQPHGSARDTWRSVVQDIDRRGAVARVHVTGGDGPGVVAEITADAVDELGLRTGEPVWVSVKATEIDAYPI